MRIALGADHAGCPLKDALIPHLESGGHVPVDCGTSNPSVSVDYPTFARLVAEMVARGDADMGILVCGTGIGMSMAANKVHGIRAALVHDVTTARLSRLHNNANVLCLGGRLISEALAIEILDTFLDTGFEARHQSRLDMISEIEHGG